VRCRHRHGAGPEGMWLKNARKIGDKQHQTPSGTTIFS
jgi:hypothetical protein